MPNCGESGEKLVPMESVSLRSYSDAYKHPNMNVETQIPLELVRNKWTIFSFPSNNTIHGKMDVCVKWSNCTVTLFSVRSNV